MKLLELCLSKGFGGLELYAEKIIRHYHNNGLQCIPVISKGSLLDDRLLKAKIPCVYSKVLNQYFPILSAWRLARLCSSKDISTIHIHWRKDFPLAVFTRLFCSRPLRLVYTRQMALTKPKYDLYHRFLYRYVDCYLTITKNLEGEARRFLPIQPEKIQLLYYGVPERKQVEATICSEYFGENKLQQDAFTVALFGRIEYGKGQHLLVEAMSKLISDGKNIQAAIIGHVMDQSYYKNLEDSADKVGLDKSIRFCGFHHDPTSIMGCFDVVVLASYAETFGLVLPEAMRAGTAVIGTNSGGVPEIIQDGITGLLFNPGNPDELAECLKKLIDNPDLRERIAKQGKVFADENFSEEMHFKRLEALLAGKPI